MVVYPCDIHKVSRLLTRKKGQLKKEVPSVAMMTNFGFGPMSRRFEKFSQALRQSIFFKPNIPLSLDSYPQGVQGI